MSEIQENASDEFDDTLTDAPVHTLADANGRDSHSVDNKKQLGTTKSLIAGPPTSTSQNPTLRDLAGLHRGERMSARNNLGVPFARYGNLVPGKENGKESTGKKSDAFL